jgi:hypothetical protein
VSFNCPVLAENVERQDFGLSASAILIAPCREEGQSPQGSASLRRLQDTVLHKVQCTTVQVWHAWFLVPKWKIRGGCGVDSQFFREVQADGRFIWDDNGVQDDALAMDSIIWTVYLAYEEFVANYGTGFLFLLLLLLLLLQQ